jgi:hypothetical protein
MSRAVVSYYHLGGGPLPTLYLRGQLYRKMWSEFGLSMNEVDARLNLVPLGQTRMTWMLDLLALGDREQAAEKE